MLEFLPMGTTKRKGGEKAWLQKNLLNIVVSISNSSYQPQNSYHPVPHIAQGQEDEPMIR